MLNPFQKKSLQEKINPSIYNRKKIEPENKPNILKCFEHLNPEARVRASGRAYMSLCPFHGEDNPSFAMYEDSNSYYCFTCAVSGDSYNFLMVLLSLTFSAAKNYAEENGLFD